MLVAPHLRDMAARCSSSSRRLARAKQGRLRCRGLPASSLVGRNASGLVPLRALLTNGWLVEPVELSRRGRPEISTVRGGGSVVVAPATDAAACRARDPQ